MTSKPTAFLLLITLGVLSLTQCSPLSTAAESAAAGTPEPTPIENIPLIHVPRLETEDLSALTYSQMAIFWFGQVTTQSNYSDVRISYNQAALMLNLAVFDHDLMHAESPAPSTLTQWDSVAVYLQTTPASSDLSTQAYQFIVQASPGYESFAWYQTANQWNGRTWYPQEIAFTSHSGWRGSAFDDNQPDMGWNTTLTIPFSSLGLSAPPAEGTEWRLGIELYDRDSRAELAPPPQSWPEAFTALHPNRWGRIAFGRPNSTSIDSPTPDLVLEISGSQDAGVGGGSNCGAGLDYWTVWGNKNWTEQESQQAFVNIQNQRDVADWPCFSKYYLKVPLTQAPPEAGIKAAYIRLHQFGNAGQVSTPNQPYRSYIQAFTTRADWNASSLTWNNAPPALENIALTTVEPVEEFPNWPGVPVYWDVTEAVRRALQANQPLSLVFYSADGAYHSGKYFTTGDAQEWNASARPALLIEFAEEP